MIGCGVVGHRPGPPRYSYSNPRRLDLHSPFRHGWYCYVFESKVTLSMESDCLHRLCIGGHAECRTRSGGQTVDEQKLVRKLAMCQAQTSIPQPQHFRFSAPASLQQATHKPCASVPWSVARRRAPGKGSPHIYGKPKPEGRTTIQLLPRKRGVTTCELEAARSWYPDVASITRVVHC